MQIKSADSKAIRQEPDRSALLSVWIGSVILHFLVYSVLPKHNDAQRRGMPPQCILDLRTWCMRREWAQRRKQFEHVAEPGAN